MCACKFRVGKITDATTGDYKNFILANAFVKDDFESQLDFIFCTNPQKVRDAFKPLGLEIKNEKDLKVLVNAHKQGLDKKEFGKDFRDVALSIFLTQAELNNASCKIMFVK
ncbi:MAG: hypothetical protein US53_C0070G0001 [Candidatus Woesebacteria bacterium GW2011_GWA1_37_7]|uniref:Uncharacterized protein n=1 Tax=Candidatus Woesebacteria bacterium GW2011_GWA1_37_7 TaxID=1618545 RepID=A0A0G0H0S3_9BACT|nr:MAG: hypothetical protein US53_C0070G0001 [Candidatus Woesebacteria bacterium GW2011_GWA1_37_7]